MSVPTCRHWRRTCQQDEGLRRTKKGREREEYGAVQLPLKLLALLMFKLARNSPEINVSGDQSTDNELIPLQSLLDQAGQSGERYSAVFSHLNLQVKVYNLRE